MAANDVYENVPLFDLILNDTAFKYPYRDHNLANRFKRSTDDVFDNKSNIALYIVAPIMFVVFSSCCGIYCCYKCREYVKENEPVKNIKAKVKSIFRTETPTKDDFSNNFSKKSRSPSVQCLKNSDANLPNSGLEKQKLSPNIYHVNNKSDLGACSTSNNCSLHLLEPPSFHNCKENNEDHPFEIKSSYESKQSNQNPKNITLANLTANQKLENQAKATSENNQAKAKSENNQASIEYCDISKSTNDNIISVSDNCDDSVFNPPSVQAFPFGTYAYHQSKKGDPISSLNQSVSLVEEQSCISTIDQSISTNNYKCELISLGGSISNQACELPPCSSPEYIQHNSLNRICPRSVVFNVQNTLDSQSQDTIIRFTEMPSSRHSSTSNTSFASPERRQKTNTDMNQSTAYRNNSSNSAKFGRPPEKNSVVTCRDSKNDKSMYKIMAQKGLQMPKNKRNVKKHKDSRIVDHWK